MKLCYLLLVAASLLVGAGPGKLTESEQYRRAALRNPESRPIERLGQYRHYDFAPLFTQEQDATEGFIGPNCQRLRIRLLSVRRDTADSARYQLTGKTLVRQQLSSFSGTLVLRHVRELRQLAVNGEAATVEIQRAFRGARREGFVLADYELRENPSQPASGIFRGVMRLNWYVNRQGQLRYDYVYNEGDGGCNKQCVGTWTSYATGSTLRCNWGDFRIPNSGDFDIGAGEFSPNPKYYTYGWQNYAALYSDNSTAAEQARRHEKQIWWK